MQASAVSSDNLVELSDVLFGYDARPALRAEMGLDILQGYGLTECSIVTWNRDRLSKAGSVGYPLREDYQVEVRGDDGELKPRTVRGEIIVRSPTVMTGYFGRPEETRAYLDDGWLATGDIGYLDEAGYLYFAGLKKNVDPRWAGTWSI